MKITEGLKSKYRNDLRPYVLLNHRLLRVNGFVGEALPRVS